MDQYIGQSAYVIKEVSTCEFLTRTAQVSVIYVGHRVLSLWTWFALCVGRIDRGSNPELPQFMKGALTAELPSQFDGGIINSNHCVH